MSHLFYTVNFHRLFEKRNPRLFKKSFGSYLFIPEFYFPAIFLSFFHAIFYFIFFCSKWGGGKGAYRLLLCKQKRSVQTTIYFIF